jgi:hypothetical protein
MSGSRARAPSPRRVREGKRRIHIRGEGRGEGLHKRDVGEGRPQQRLCSSLNDAATRTISQSKFEELLIIDNDGRVVASTHAPHEGTSAAEIEYFRAGSGDAI